MVTGVNHVTLAVTDVPRAFAFYTEVLGFRAVARWPKGAYLRASELWLAIEVGRPAPAPDDRSHIAFAVSAEDFAGDERADQKVRRDWLAGKLDRGRLHVLPGP